MRDSEVVVLRALYRVKPRSLSFGEVARASGVKGPQHVASALKSLQKRKLIERDIDTRRYRALDISEGAVFLQNVTSFLKEGYPVASHFGLTVIDNVVGNQGFAEWLCRRDGPYRESCESSRAVFLHEWRHYYAGQHAKEAKQLEDYLGSLPAGPGAGFPPVEDGGCKDPLCRKFRAHDDRDKLARKFGIDGFVPNWIWGPSMLQVLPSVNWNNWPQPPWEAVALSEKP